MLSLRVGPIVRATTANAALIWGELVQPGEVTLYATPVTPSASGNHVVQPQSASAKTVTVGNRYYVALQLTGLQPATWYTYRIQPVDNNASEESQALPLQCFRTLNQPDENRPFTLAYGSCRRLAAPRLDALSAFGAWLIRHYEQREEVWPRLLLMIGDQIYADEPTLAAKRFNPNLRAGARNFADFASLYEFAWTRDANVRQLLAALPTYMICDDHEVTNGWNTLPFWRATALKQGNEQLLVDGLVAYWIYQGWGNLRNSEQSKQETTNDPRLQIMEQAATSGEDALDALRECMRSAVYGQTRLRWYYSIPTTPPIFICDARADREAGLSGSRAAPRAGKPARIMSRPQMADFKSWLNTHHDQLALIASSVPVLLPPVIGFGEYIMGQRLQPHGSGLWRRLLHLMGHVLGRRQLKFAEGMSFDHWPLFAQTWQEIVSTLTERQHDILVLSGDVHFSYTATAELAQSGTTKEEINAQARLLQFVCSPFANRLGTQSRRMILGQSWCHRLSYGGLHTRICPLHDAPDENDGNKRIYNDLLLGNSLALITLQPQSDGKYHIQQNYYGSHDGQLKVVASSTIQTK